jgi:hypothetical protein
VAGVVIVAHVTPGIGWLAVSLCPLLNFWLSVVPRLLSNRSRHTIRRRDVHALDGILRRVPEQAAQSGLHLQNLPPERVLPRGSVPRHPTEPLEPNLRRLGHPDESPESVARSEPEQVRTRVVVPPSRPRVPQSDFLVPCSDSPANTEAATLYRDNMTEYKRRVRESVEASWVDTEDGEGDEDAEGEEGDGQGEDEEL